MRITPRITPYVPKPQYFKPSHIARAQVRGLATGNLPIRVRVPHISTSGVTASAPKIKTLLQQTHTGRAPAANPKPKSPSQQTGISAQPKSTRPARPPASTRAMQPGVHTLQGFKMKARRSSPFKMPKIKV